MQTRPALRAPSSEQPPWLLGWLRVGSRAFLRTVHRGACDLFTTVLGPNANSFHADHFHLDLARHGKDGSHKVCE